MRIYAVYGFGGVLMLEYDTKEVLLSVGTREAFGYKRAGSVSSIRSASRIRGSDPRVSRKQLADRTGGPTRE